jgi:hypothetical protein
MRVVTVLKSGGDFKPLHVQALQKQVGKWAPFATFQCLTDMDVPGVDCIPLKRNWPGWWSKMELFDPELPGGFLFMDLDTVIVGPLDDIEKVDKLTLLRDFYRDGVKLREGLGGGLIYFPAGDERQPLWNDFNIRPSLTMAMNRRGDQHYFEHFWLRRGDRWQNVVPSQVVSYKVHCTHGIPPDARVLCFHGKPRPWEVGLFLHLYR